MSYLFVKESRNRKTGPIPVTYSSRTTCPSNCGLMNNGCYAETGPTFFQWRRCERDGALDLDQLVNKIDALPSNTLWRHNVAGDLPGEGDTIDPLALEKLVDANQGKRGFTFTHKPTGGSATGEANRHAIERAVAAVFAVNLSADSISIADRLGDRVRAPLTTLLPMDAPAIQFTPKGRKVIACPGEKPEVTCMDCGWCARTDRPWIVGFRAHGPAKRKVDLIARSAA